MSRIKPRLHVATFPTQLNAVITDADWVRMESAYGYTLSAEVRSGIFQTTRYFLDRVPGETAAELAEDAIDRVERLHKAGQAFWNEFVKLGDGHPEFLINEQFSPNSIDRFNLFSEMLQTYVAKCENALNYLKDPNNHGWQKWTIWSRWINNLLDIAGTHGLPTSVRKDTDKNKKGPKGEFVPSPFVAFVRELQQCVPAQYRRSTQSDSALSDKIDEARGGNKPLTSG